MGDRACPVCGSGSKAHVFRQRFVSAPDISVLSGYDVVVCKECGMGYADGIPAQAAFDHYYAVLSKYEFMDRQGVVSDDHRRQYGKIVDFIMPHVPQRSARILDLGCSTGALLSVFKERGYSHLLGVDPSPSCAKTARELYDIEVVTQDIRHFHSSDGFDVVILSAVLEHYVELSEVMAKVTGLLKEGGLLFVEVPDVGRFDAHVEAPFQQFSVEHINYFSNVSLANLLLRSGFSPLAVVFEENHVARTVDPDIYIMARKGFVPPAAPVRDELTQVRLQRYVALSTAIANELHALVNRKTGTFEKVIVWGAGTHTQRLIGAGFDLGKVLFFVDANQRYWGHHLAGIEICPPEKIRGHKAPVLVSTYAHQDEIERQLRQVLRLDNEIIKLY
jgi:2-polyprenyl-3-methyl-5-hydroxy-6-metoxy-1,4-benzoquinol methylase